LKTILLLFGGKSAEHEVSIISANSLLMGIGTGIFDIVPVKISKNGDWCTPIDSKKDLLSEVHHKLSFPVVEPDNLIAFIKKQIDVVFPLLHGTYGEDGAIQGFCEIIGKPYVGAGVLGSSVGMDKDVTKTLLRNSGITVVPSATIRYVEWEADNQKLLNSISDKFKYPIFIKPCNSGSSIGITKVKSADELKSAINFAFQFDSKLLVEPGLEVREIEISVLGNEKVNVSIPGEIHPGAEFYDYNDKYHSASSWSEIPAKLNSETIESIQIIAQNAFIALNLNGMARIDFFIDKKSNEIFINEVNTIPGFTPISMYPKMWEASGIGYSALIEKLVDLAIARFKQREKIADRFLNL